MSLAVLISLNAVMREVFHHGFDQLHIWQVGTAFSAACSMHSLMLDCTIEFLWGSMSVL